MRFTSISALLLTLWAGSIHAASAQGTNAFSFHDGDRIAFLGDTFMEREGQHGHLELALTLRFPDLHFIVRNLGWSADTPAGVSRAGFDTPDQGFVRLREQLALVKPTVVFLGYGMASSFDGEAGLPRFKREMNQLLDAVVDIAGGSNRVRFVIVSPIPHEHRPAPLPDPTKHNEQLALYTAALHELATQRGARFIDLFARLNNPFTPSEASALTDNGIHLNALGSRRAAEEILTGLGWPPYGWRIGLTRDGKIRPGSQGAKVISFETLTNRARFVILEDRLAGLSPLEGGRRLPLAAVPIRLQIQTMAPNNYDFLIDGKYVNRVTELDCRSGMVIDAGPSFDQAEDVRQLILKKNKLFFYRWRPENNTYLFLFRKNEQGQNAKEIPQFDPLIEAQEKQIAALSHPVQHTLELIPATIDRRPAPRPMKESPPLTARPLPAPEFDVDPNLEITLFAENPLLAKPIQMNFDARGRLWVASSSVYPQIQPGQEADDRILILEDADGDGRAEKSTVFADGLLIPTGVEPGNGGCYVGQSTELLFLKDTDSDGRADQRRIVLSGFGTEDTHHILHTLRWGQDGQLYMNQSIYIHTHTETPHGVTRLNSGGILGLRPDTLELGILMKGLVNCWGHAIDDYGQSFATDGASSADAGLGGLNHVVPQAMYFTYERARRRMDSISPGSYPKFCSLEMVKSPHFPDDWQGQFVTCDFRAHRIVRFAIEEKGSSYITKEMPDLVRSKDVTFRPIDIKLGPDGALYVADWSNPIIQHGEVDFRDARRDHEHGRIWRITHKNRPLVPKEQLVDVPASALFKHLISSSAYLQRQTRRVLAEMGPNILTDLHRWLANESSERAKLEALWLHQAVDRVDERLLGELLQAKDAHVRAAAVRVLGAWLERRPGREGGSSSPIEIAAYAVGWPSAPLRLEQRQEIPAAHALEWLAARVADDHPRVRLEAVRALARVPQARAAELVLSALERPMDPTLDYAIWLTINDLAPYWIEAIRSGAWLPEGREKQLEFGLKAIEPAQASVVLGQLLGPNPLARDGRGPWIDLIGAAGTPVELGRLWEQVVRGEFEDAAAARALESLDRAARLRSLKPQGDLNGLVSLLGKPEPAVRSAAARLAGAWKEKGPVVTLLGQLAGDSSAPLPLRLAAIEALRDTGGTAARAALLPLVGKESARELRRGAVVALVALDPDGGVPRAAEALRDLVTEDDALPLWRALLNLKGAANALTKVISKTALTEPVAKAGLRAAREGGRSEPDLILALNRAGNLSEGEVTLTEAESKQLAADVGAHGDAARGETIFRRRELSCVACHAIGGVGGKVGPDMTSIGASAPIDYLIESVWFPNKKIKEGYHAVMIETKDGEESSGVLVRENNEQIVLRDATGKENAIAKNNVKDRRVGAMSLMPAGLIDALTASDRVDLFRFLSELGKPGPFDATKGNVARFWRLRAENHQGEQFGEDSARRGRWSDPEWAPAFSLVDGRLPQATIREALASADRYRAATGLYAGAELTLAKGGEIQLRLAGASLGSLWIDGKIAAPTPAGAVSLSEGTHRFVIRLDPRRLPENLRLEASEGTFATN